MNRTHLSRQGLAAGRNRQGMTLLEVLIALTVFAMVAISLVTTLDSAFDAAMDRNNVDQALLGLENQMALLHAARVQTCDKDLPDDGSGFVYHLVVNNEQMQDQKKQPVPNMLRATITAKWKSRGEAEERVVTELIYQP